MRETMNYIKPMLISFISITVGALALHYYPTDSNYALALTLGAVIFSIIIEWSYEKGRD